MGEKSERDLISCARGGDREAMSELFRRHYASSVATARRILREEDSWDAVQSAYLAAFRNLPFYRGESTFKTWLTRIVINQCFMRLREPARFQSMSMPGERDSGEAPRFLVDRGLSPEESASQAEMRAALLVAISRLPKPFSDVFTLYSIGGLSIRDTAARLGLTVPATKTRLHRARSRMRTALKGIV